MPTLVIHNHRLLFLNITLLLMVIRTAGNGFFFTEKKLAYPPGSAMGLFLALAVPIDIPRKNVFVAYNFEANYNLPDNDTLYDTLDDYIADASANEGRKFSLRNLFNRTVMYKILETKLESHGYSGQGCLLRTVCEVSSSFLGHNGILGDLLHVVLLPSTSADEGLPNIYKDAETEGKKTKNCERFYNNCSISFMDLITWIGS